MPTEKIEIKYRTIPLGDDLARSIVVNGETWFHEDDVADAFFQLESKSLQKGFEKGFDAGYGEGLVDNAH